MAVRMRNACFTLIDYTDDDITFLSGIVDYRVNGRQVVKYIIFQKEHGREVSEEFPLGRPHLQGYMEFVGQKTANSLNRMNETFTRMHMRKRRYSQAQAIAYCRKTGRGGRDEGTEVYEFGTKNAQGAPGHPGKNRYSQIAEEIRDGATFKQISEKYGAEVIQKRNGILNYIEDNSEDRNWKPDIEIYYSEESGVGKSYTARTRYPEAYFPPWPKGGRWWWPNYQKQEVIVLDEFRHQISYDVMIHEVMDWGAWNVEAKGTNTKCVAKKIIITTNIAPWKWYPKKTVAEASMLQRRLKEFAKIFKFRSPLEWYEVGDEDEDGDIVQERRPKPSFEEVELQDREEPVQELNFYQMQ